MLPLEVVQRIAAGEVITAYDSVVQELVENAIDADASRVNVDVDFAARRVTVRDNGAGISAEQGLARVAECNATSKLRTLSQLGDGVRTLGFRGQGLWAVAMTAERLDVSSRTSGSLCGMHVAFASDDSPRNEPVPVGMAEGTIVSAAGLPWSTDTADARRMMKQCKDWLIRAALCYPHISFHLSRNGKSTWRATANDSHHHDARARLLANELRLPVSEFRTASMSIRDVCSVSIVVGTPSVVYSSSKSWMVTAVNGRCVGIPSLRRAISRALDVRNRRYPVAFVNIIAEPGLVNWNVLPKKTKVRFNSSLVEEKLIEAVSSLVQDALHGNFIAQNVQTPSSEKEEPILANDEIQGGMREVVSMLSQKTSTQAIGSSEGADFEGNYAWANGNNTLPGLLTQARVVAQVLNTYILVEHKGGIILVEQHVADERVMYEQLVQSWKNSRFVKMQEPLKLPKDMSTEWVFVLTTLGLIRDDDIEILENGVYEVTAIPEVMARISRSNLLAVLLQICREGWTIEEASASVACRLAVKNGTSLTMREMESIVRRLMVCGNGFTCPHGRPIFVELHTKELANLFGRSWTPERVGGMRNDQPANVLKRRGVIAE